MQKCRGIWVIVWTLFFLIGKAMGQPVSSDPFATAKALYDAENYAASANGFHQAATVFRRNENRFAVAKSLFWEGKSRYWWFREQNGETQLDSSILKLREALSFLPANNSADSVTKLNADIHCYLHFGYKKKSDLWGALQARLGQLALELKMSEPSAKEVATGYMETANMYNRIGDPQRAVQQLQQALLYDPPPQVQRSIYFNMATAWQSSGNKTRAIQEFRQSLRIATENKSTNSTEMAESQLGLASAFLNIGNADSTDFYFKKCKRAIDNNSPFDLQRMAKEVEADLALLKKDTAAYFRLQGNVIQFLEQRGAPPRQVARALLEQANIRLHKKQWPLALKEIRTALEALIGEEVTRPGQVTNSGKADPWIYVACLRMGDFYAQRQKANSDFINPIEQLSEALLWYSAATDQVDLMRRAFESRFARDQLTAKVYEAYEKGIRTALELNELTLEKQYLEAAFLLSERSKSASLLDQVYSARAYNDLGLPPEILNELRRLNLEINAIDPFDAALNPQLKSLQDSLTSLKRMLQVEYPRFYTLRFEDYHLKVSELYEKLGPLDLFTEYFLGDSALYCFFVTEKSIELQVVNRSEGFDSIFTSVLNYVQNGDNWADNDGWFQFVDEAKALGDWLMGPFANKFITTDTVYNWLVVPDGLLGLFPFEVLPWKSPSSYSMFRGYPWGLEKYRVHFTPSASLYWKFPERNATQGGEMLAVGLTFEEQENHRLEFNDTTLFYGKLANVRQEIAYMKEMVRGEYLLDESGTRENFLARLDNQSVLHFATHSFISSDAPLTSRILMGPPGPEGALYAYELYGMNLNADLAVLSFCEAGIGHDLRGEGISSIARGFAFAGCPSIVYSLWELEDKSALEIMEAFYRHLKQGKSKSEALRYAKLAFLKDARTTRSHPFFWACYTLSGSDDTLDLQEPESELIVSNSLHWQIPLVSLLLILCWMAVRAVRDNYSVGSSQ